MNPRKLILCLFLAALACGSFAQGFGGGGQGQGRRFGMMMGGGAMPSSMLLGREDVQTDLALTDDQKTKLTELQTSLRDKMREAFQGAQGDRDAIRKAFQSVQEEAEKKVKEILTPDQQKRLLEINIQLSGNRSILIPDVQKGLALTDDQKAKAKGLSEKAGEANQSVFEKVRNGEISREDVQGIMEKNRKALDDELGKLLTDDQKAKLKDMAGKPFEAKDQ